MTESVQKNIEGLEPSVTPSEKRSNRRINLLIKYGSILCMVLITTELAVVMVYLNLEAAELNYD